MKILKKIIALTILSLTIAVAVPSQFNCSALVVEAHSGRTDSRGGHHDYKNKSGLGSYHYHHGYSAHLHTNGVCPYSNSSSSSSYTQQQPAPTNYVYTYTAKYKYASTEYSNRVANNQFSQSIIDLMPNYQNVISSLLSQQEIEDYTYLKNAQDVDDMSKLIFVRMYDYILAQQSQQQQSFISAEYDNLIFSAQYYITKYPDLITVFGYDAEALHNHFMTCGINEGRQGISTFNVNAYRANNPDLEAVFGDNLILYCNHYLGGGHHEGRACH